MPDTVFSQMCDRGDTCALAGAAAFFCGIPGAEVVANGPYWCYFYAIRQVEGFRYDLSDRFLGSQPDNEAIVYGTEKFLRETIGRLVDAGHHPSVLFVENSCSISLIGDDLEGILRSFRLPFPVVTMDSGGIRGGFAEGWSKAFLRLLDKLPDGAGETQGKTERPVVNLIGLSEYYQNGEADRKELVRILEKAGYTVGAVPGAGSPLEAVRRLGDSDLNIVCHEELGLPAARALEKRCGTPFVKAGLPYGVEGTKRWLRVIEDKLPVPAHPELDRELDEMQALVTLATNNLQMEWAQLRFPSIVIAAPGSQALCLAAAIRNEMADTDVLTVLCRNPVEDEACYGTAADRVLVAGRDDEAIHAFLEGADRLLLFGSSVESLFLHRLGRHYQVIDIAKPARDEVLLHDVPWMGIRGTAHLVQELWNRFIADLRNHGGVYRH